jgi:hypothetical protein
MTEALEARAIACEKNFGKCAGASVSVDRIRCESRESLASDSRKRVAGGDVLETRDALTEIFFGAADERRVVETGGEAQSRRAPTRWVRCRACA